jgi:signal transduction histidine kinase
LPEEYKQVEQERKRNLTLIYLIALALTLAFVWLLNFIGFFELLRPLLPELIFRAILGFSIIGFLIFLTFRERVARDKAEKLVEELEKARKRIGELVRQVIDAQERERQYLAAEIHDDLLQSLVSTFYFLQMIDVSLLDEKAKERQERLIEVVKSSIERGRTLIREIEPIREPELGLVEAIKRAIDLNFSDGGVRVNFKYPDDLSDLSLSVKINILRIVQEALINVRKHAQATKVFVEIIRVGENNIEVVVRDNGVGFDVGEVSQQVVGHYGLLTMQERAKLINGQLFIESKPGEGTVIRGVFPLKKG